MSPFSQLEMSPLLDNLINPKRNYGYLAGRQFDGDITHHDREGTQTD